MSLSSLGVTPTAPPKYLYENDETGDKIVSDSRLNADGTPYTEPTDNTQAVQATENAPLGARPIEAQEPQGLGRIGPPANGNPDFESNPSDVYGNNPLVTRAYEIKDPEKTIEGISTVRSKTNSWTLLNYRNYAGGTTYGDPEYGDWGTAVVGTGAMAAEVINPTAHRIVTHCEENGGVGFSYAYRDFIQTEHYGQISNEYLVTLRRFSFPVGDDIVNAKSYDESGAELDISEPDLARAITWLSPKLGNNLTDILSFGTGFGWEEIQSSVQTASGGSTEKRRGTIGGLIDGSPIAKAAEAGANGYTASESDRINTIGQHDALGDTYPNMVYGPYNAIKSVLARDDKGLKFDNEFKLNFYYDLRGFDKTSPKVVFMDVISNLLAIALISAK